MDKGQTCEYCLLHPAVETLVWPTCEGTAHVCESCLADEIETETETR